jgi:hypothetical protein
LAVSFYGYICAISDYLIGQEDRVITVSLADAKAHLSGARRKDDPALTLAPFRAAVHRGCG